VSQTAVIFTSQILFEHSVYYPMGFMGGKKLSE